MKETPFIPNFTQIPNFILDQLMSTLSDSEFKCIMYIARRTYGFQKDTDRISYTQFESGITDKDKGTGLARSTIARGLEQLVQKGLLLRKDTSLGAIYEICLDYNDKNKLYSKQTQLLNCIQNETTTVFKTKPQLYSKRNIQNKEEIKRNKDSKKTSFLTDLQIKEVIDSFKEVNPLYLKFYSNTTQRNALHDIAEAITFEKLLSVVKSLPNIINKPYAPKITTPTDLKRDLGKLIAFYKQEKGLSANTTKIII